MAISSTGSLARTLPLRDPEWALLGIQQLHRDLDPYAISGLIDLIYFPHSAPITRAAIKALQCVSANHVVQNALLFALGSENTTCRLTALYSLENVSLITGKEDVENILLTDSAWTVRRAAIKVISHWPQSQRRILFQASTDPHWRVRMCLGQVFQNWAKQEHERNEILHDLDRIDHIRARGLRDYLLWRWRGIYNPPCTDLENQNKSILPDWWDDDPAVLAHQLEFLGAKGRANFLEFMPNLLAHEEERIRKLAGETLRTTSRINLLVQALDYLEDTRSESAQAVESLLQKLNWDQKEALARHLLHSPLARELHLAWAIDQVEVIFPAKEEEQTLRNIIDKYGPNNLYLGASLAHLAGRWEFPGYQQLLKDCLLSENIGLPRAALKACLVRSEEIIEKNLLAHYLMEEDPSLRSQAVRLALKNNIEGKYLEPIVLDPDGGVRLALAEGLKQFGREEYLSLALDLQNDPDPRVRSAAMTSKRAQELLANPEQETSWAVLARAAQICKVSLWKLYPETVTQPVVEPSTQPLTLTPIIGGGPLRRSFGPSPLSVSPLAISGAYGLPVDGFIKAMEEGINLFFWEPSYQTLQEFIKQLSPRNRQSLHLIAGTFEANPKKIVKDVDRALRLLQLECLALFQLFWVRSRRRFADEVRHCLEKLQENGKISMYGLSTHSRPLALEAIQQGWNPVMVRYSAAHRGAEELIFPTALKSGTSLIAFNITNYGRLLHSSTDQPKVTGADCLRFAFAQPAITVCLSAPATIIQLQENLTALINRDMGQIESLNLARHGELIYREDRVFRKLIRIR